MGRLDRRELKTKWTQRWDAYEKLRALYSDECLDAVDPEDDLPPDSNKATLYKQLSELCSEFVKDLSLL